MTTRTTTHSTLTLYLVAVAHFFLATTRTASSFTIQSTSPRCLGSSGKSNGSSSKTSQEPILVSQRRITHFSRITNKSGTAMFSTKGEGTNTNNSLLDSIVTKIGSTTSIVVAGTVYVVLCYKRDALLVSFWLGAIGNAIFGKILKKVLNIQRPEAGVDQSKDVPAIDQPSDNGMPSSHAMSLGFIGTFTALCLPITTLPILVYAAMSLRYRIKVNLHTFDQIAVGGILGTLDGFLWWNLCCNPDFAWFGGSIDIPNLVTSTGILNEQGLLPWPYLVGCSAVGIAVVGSVERRLKFFLGRAKKSE